MRLYGALRHRSLVTSVRVGTLFFPSLCNGEAADACKSGTLRSDFLSQKKKQGRKGDPIPSHPIGTPPYLGASAILLRCDRSRAAYIVFLIYTSPSQPASHQGEGRIRRKKLRERDPRNRRTDGPSHQAWMAANKAKKKKCGPARAHGHLQAQVAAPRSGGLKTTFRLSSEARAVQQRSRQGDPQKGPAMGLGWAVEFHGRGLGSRRGERKTLMLEMEWSKRHPAMGMRSGDGKDRPVVNPGS